MRVKYKSLKWILLMRAGWVTMDVTDGVALMRKIKLWPALSAWSL